MDSLTPRVAYRYAATKTYYHGSANPNLTSLRSSNDTFALLGPGVYLYAKEAPARQFYGPYVYKVSLPTGLKIMPENFELSLENVETILNSLHVDIPENLESLPGGVTKPLWWFTDGWLYFNADREETAKQVGLFLNVNKGFDGMLATYPKGGKVLVLWEKYEKLRPELLP
jgi:hypothetical protein